MKIAVYTIALNEEQFVQAWHDSAKAADYLLIADTGSTDKTVELAESLGINVVPLRVSPFRFDDARNAALAALPIDIDYCIALDMDEVLVDGWRDTLEAVKPGVTRPRYKYTWSWNPDGSPGLQYGGDKIHSRIGYRWKHPVHEVLVSYGQEEVQDWISMEIHHHADSSKPRSQYLPLLELSVREDPSDDRNAFYFARELFFYGRTDEAAREFRRYLELPTAKWDAERSAAYRYLAKCELQYTLEHLTTACEEAPHLREPLVELARYHHDMGNWAECLMAGEAALSITEKPLVYINEAWAWGELPYDLSALAAYHLGDASKAVEYGERAAILAPNDERIQINLKYYREALDGNARIPSGGSV